METKMKKGRMAAIYFALFCLLMTYLLVSVGKGGNALYYDNTSIESRVNVTNKAPDVSLVNLYKFSDSSQVTIDLTEGTTTTLVCNGTVEDWNGWQDIIAVNATIYENVSYNSNSPNDNNFHYTQTSCTNSSRNITTLMFSCSFNVWYYANNAGWNCNMTAKDGSNATDNDIDPSNPVINILAALNLTTNVMDFGEMQPGETTTNAAEPVINVTNSGNVNINLSVDGFGLSDGDGLAMKCDVGNISLGNLRYNVSNDQGFATNMWNLTDSKLPSGIPFYTVNRRVDDGDTLKINSTNPTYWKLMVPPGVVKGFCNGTVTFSAVI
jgi:hypothetical protein